MKQLGLGLDMKPVKNSMFWCCCPHMSDKHSLIWMPPDQKRGRCAYCGKIYTFASAYGREES